MSGQIRISPREVRETSDKIKIKAEDANTLVQNLSNDVENLQSFWDGAAQNAFVEKFRALKANEFKQLIECVLSISESLNNIAFTMEEADRQIANQINQVS